MKSCRAIAAIGLLPLVLSSGGATETKSRPKPVRIGTLSAGIENEKKPRVAAPVNPVTPILVKEKKPADLPGSEAPVPETPQPEGPPPPTIDDLLKELLAHSGLPARRKTRLLAMAGGAYTATGYQALWPGANPDIVIERITDYLRSHAIDPFAIPEMVPDEPIDWPKTGLPVDDARLTLQVAEAALLLKEGPATPESIWPSWNQGDTPGTIDSRTHTANVSRLFSEELQKNRDEPEVMLRSFVPANWIYQRLRGAWIASEAYPNPDPIKYGGLIRSGTVSPRVREIAIALKIQGFLKSADLAAINDRATPKMDAAIRQFQRENGLKVDGILGPKTLGKLNRDPIRDRQLIALNMHRARFIPNDLGRRYLIANLPAGEIYGYDASQLKTRMRIVFGRNQADRRTPIFRDSMEQVILRPFWWVPNSIARNELLPKGYSYLARNGYQIVNAAGNVMRMSSANLGRVRSGTYTLRQRSGRNALGVVKFRFPNDHAVYFHDTPQKHLFKYHERDHSHGCVRLENPIGMADWILSEEPGWTPFKIRQATAYGSRTIVELADPVPVFIVYFTVFPAPDRPSGIRFLEDVYGRDMPELGTLVANSDRN